MKSKSVAVLTIKVAGLCDGYRCAPPILRIFTEPVGAALAAKLLLFVLPDSAYPPCIAFKASRSRPLPRIAQTPRSPGPVRRPSGGAVQRGIWHGCQMRNDGPWMALRDDPRNSAGTREVWRSQARMPGALSLWLLSLSRKQRESNSL